jgi:hypothetical protein
VSGNLTGESFGVAPVQRHQQIEIVVHTLDRLVLDAHQRRRFTTANLRPEGAPHHAEAAVVARHAEQQFSGGDASGTAGAGYRDGNIAGGSFIHGHEKVIC